ncbi:hypothetical protein J437_LFUL003170 [Ladona fulva]|uniref:Cytochrome P450 n=1 Tax=Ladona fulva TaxID=123851 RepID=A0A8K0JXH4_LADFU|nr:hypothetical protein J437_LFUL003170 [Ladona fulva]
MPYVTPSFPFGNFERTALLRENVGFTAKKIYDEGKGYPIVGYFVLIEPFLLVRDPALVRSVLVTRFDHFSQRGHLIPPESVDSMMGRSIFGLPIPEWKCLRRNLTPCFAGTKLKAMFPMVNRCSKRLMRLLGDAAERHEGLLDVRDTMKRFQTDVICETLLAKLLKLRFTPVSAEHFFHVVLQRHLNAGKEDTRTSVGDEATFRTGFVDTLMRMRETPHCPNIPPLSEEKVMAQMAFFFLAGFETTSTTLTFCLFELSRHPTIQKRLAAEIMDVLKDNDWELDYSSLSKMTYMEKVIQETLRKYPVVPLLSRECVQNYAIPGSDWTIKKGTKVSVSVLGLHYDPIYFPDPTRFDPGRFDKSEVAKRPPACYIPYSLGPKACIGGQFAVFSMKVALAEIVSKYEVHPSDSTPEVLPIDPCVFQFSPKGPVMLKFHRRRKSLSDSASRGVQR